MLSSIKCYWRRPFFFYTMGFHHYSDSCCRYNDVIMSTMPSQISSPTIVYSTVYSGADQRKHQSSTSLAFVRGIHRWPMNSPHKGPVTRKMFPFDGVIMSIHACALLGLRSWYVPCHVMLLLSLRIPVIWWLGARRWNLRLSDLQMKCGDLTIEDHTRGN